jgi:hypothetical protein
MKRDDKKLAARLKISVTECQKLYLPEGQLFIENNKDDEYGQYESSDVADGNKPPTGQPGLWMHWHCPDRATLEFDNGEKFYYYEEWLKYLIHVIFAPRGYVLNGEVEYFGEDRGDTGILAIQSNEVFMSPNDFEDDTRSFSDEEEENSD